MTAKEAAEILEGELKSLSSARGSDYSGVLALEHAISVLQELPDEQAARPNIRQEMAQKCRNDAWGQQVESVVAESIDKVICGINSTEICNQIVSDNLRNWCERMQCKLRIAMNYMPYQGKALSSAQPEHLHTVMQKIKKKYEKAMNTSGISNPMAWALYKTWKEYNR